MDLGLDAYKIQVKSFEGHNISLEVVLYDISTSYHHLYHFLELLSPNADHIRRTMNGILLFIRAVPKVFASFVCEDPRLMGNWYDCGSDTILYTIYFFRAPTKPPNQWHSC